MYSKTKSILKNLIPSFIIFSICILSGCVSSNRAIMVYDKVNDSSISAVELIDRTIDESNLTKLPNRDRFIKKLTELKEDVITNEVTEKRAKILVRRYSEEADRYQEYINCKALFGPNAICKDWKL